MGFSFPLICDLKIEGDGLVWDNEIPPGGEIGLVDRLHSERRGRFLEIRLWDGPLDKCISVL